VHEHLNQSIVYFFLCMSLYIAFSACVQILYSFTSNFLETIVQGNHL